MTLWDGYWERIQQDNVDRAIQWVADERAAGAYYPHIEYVLSRYDGKNAQDVMQHLNTPISEAEFQELRDYHRTCQIYGWDENRQPIYLYEWGT